MRSDCASVPTRGSRFSGLASMIMTSVLASGFLAQPARESNNVSARASLRIGDFAQYRHPLCAGRARDIRWLAMPGVIGKDGEGYRFFGFRWQAELIGGADREPQRREF